VSKPLPLLISQIVLLLRRARHVVALTGAGISTPSGIPDFRSPSSGLWQQVDPMVVASIFSFRIHPEAFFAWIHPLAERVVNAQPNPAHCALAELEKRGILQSIITQNIDNLHQKAGSNRVLELHGHLRQATCIRCYKVKSAAGLIQKFITDGQIPRCECGGILKPNVILFGEQLPIEVLNEAYQEARHCDLMLVLGSSLEVTPASDLPLIAWEHKARLVIINYQPTYLDSRADVVIHDDVAQVLPQIVRQI